MRWGDQPGHTEAADYRNHRAVLNPACPARIPHPYTVQHLGTALDAIVLVLHQLPRGRAYPLGKCGVERYHRRDDNQTGREREGHLTSRVFSC